MKLSKIIVLIALFYSCSKNKKEPGPLTNKKDLLVYPVDATGKNLSVGRMFLYDQDTIKILYSRDFDASLEQIFRFTNIENRVYILKISSVNLKGFCTVPIEKNGIQVTCF
jgi:hypothetical protein